MQDETIDVEDLLYNGGAGSQSTLIYLPASNVAQSAALSRPLVNYNTTTTTNTTTTKEPIYMLMELPSRALLDEMINCDQTYIVGQSQSDIIKNNNNNNNNIQIPHQACLVLDQNDGKSFAINKVETSNALVLVRPEQQKSSSTSTSTSTSTLTSLEALLLTPSRFLELIPKPMVPLLQLNELLQRDASQRRQRLKRKRDSSQENQHHDVKCEACETDNHGLTLEALANTLSCSKAQTRVGLDRLQAFVYHVDKNAINSNNDKSATNINNDNNNDNNNNDNNENNNLITYYTFLCEEIQQQVTSLILSVLTEQPDLLLNDTRINVNECVSLVEIMINQESNLWTRDQRHEVNQFGLESIIRYCLGRICVSESELDGELVAKEVAHTILLDKPEWKCLDDFMVEWIRRMPGSMVPNESLLHGVALIKDSNKTVLYVPERGMTMDADERFSKLFQLQPEWTLDQISPYAEPLLTMGASNVSTLPELIAKYSRSAINDKNVTMYRRR